MNRRVIIPNLYYAAAYKNKIISLLINNKNFVKLINPVSDSKCEYLDETDVLLGGTYVYNETEYKEQGYVFDYDFVNNTADIHKTFVYIETDIESVRQNLYTDFNLYIYIFTSKDLVRITDKTSPTINQITEMGYDKSYFSSNVYANRIDVLCDIVDRILNGTDKLQGIGTVEPAAKGYVTMFCPDKNCYGKCLKYKISNYNYGGDDYGN